MCTPGGEVCNRQERGSDTVLLPCYGLIASSQRKPMYLAGSASLHGGYVGKLQAEVFFANPQHLHRSTVKQVPELIKNKRHP